MTTLPDAHPMNDRDGEPVIVAEPGPADLPKDVPGDVPGDVPEDVPGDTGADAEGDVPGDMGADAPMALSVDVPADAAEDVAVPENVPAGDVAADDVAADDGVVAEYEDADAQAPAPPEGKELEASVEAILFVSEQAVALARLASGLAVPEQAVSDALASLGARLNAGGGGVRLREVAGGWRLTTAPELDLHVTRFVLEGQHGRLSPAAMETLAIVAYRQPISRARVAAIRGVTSDGVVRTLLARGLLSDAGTEVGTSAALLTTTELFLNKLGVRDLTDLPNLAPLLPDIETLEMQ